MQNAGKSYTESSLFTIQVWTVVCWLGITLLPDFTSAQNRNDILITEFLPDPSPSIALPESEFIELTNRSGTEINLHHFIISNRFYSETRQYDDSLQCFFCR
jgi:hypothetical protein